MGYQVNRPLSVLIFAALLAFGCSTVETVQPEEEPVREVSSPWSSVVVTGSVVNLRAGPGTEYEVLGQVHQGDTLMVTGGLEDWFRIYLRSRSLFAWIYGPLTSGTELPR